MFVDRDGSPCLGSGCDMYIADKSNTNDKSFTHFPFSFEDTTGRGENTFTGSIMFRTSEIEVFVPA